MKRLLMASLVLTLFTVAANGQPVLMVKHRQDMVSNPWLHIKWTPQAGAAYYQLRRATAWTGAATTWTTIISSPYLEVGIGTNLNQTTFWQVVPYNSSAQPMPNISNVATATASFFAEQPVVGGVTTVRASQILELRGIANSARAAAGLAPATWTHPALAAGSPITKEDFLDVRTAINAVLTQLGLTPPPYTDPALPSGTIIKKAHLDEMRMRINNYPQYVVNQGITVSERYFSPNADGVKDTTTLTNELRSTGDAHWQMNIRNTADAVVLSRTGYGNAMSFVWNGRNDAGTIQPDGTYWFEMVDLDAPGSPVSIVREWVHLDTTLPALTMPSPTETQRISNVTANGSGTVIITGTVSDSTLVSWKLERGTTQLATGTTSITSPTTLATWLTIPTPSSPIPNGPYVLKLTATDLAGNVATLERNVTVAHFRAVLTGHQISTVATPAQSVMYTSYVPFPLNQTIEVKSQATNTVVRTLFSGARAAGTFDDAWDGKNNSGQYLGDGAYFVITTVSEGAATYVWDETGVALNGGVTQYEYPTCRNESGALVACDSSTITFDPFLNKPLRINFCAGGGHVSSGCSGTGPRFIVAKISTIGEETATCDWKCFASYYVPAGAQEIVWYGTNTAGSYIAGNGTRLLVLRGENYPRNLVVLYGTAPTISIASMAPLMFNPGAGAPQSFTVNVASPVSRPISVSAQFRNMSSASILRTVTLPASTAAQQTISWDGKADNGAWVAPGTYEVILKATDSAGGTATIKPLVTVKY
jgi:flagellar hook assembly protein FlgD